MKIVLIDDDAPLPVSQDGDIAQLQALTPEIVLARARLASEPLGGSIAETSSSHDVGSDIFHY